MSVLSEFFLLCMCSLFSSTPIGVYDAMGRLAALIANHPASPDWDSAVQEMSDVLGELGPQCKFPANGRGDFGTLSSGIGYGGGQYVHFILPVWTQ